MSQAPTPQPPKVPAAKPETPERVEAESCPAGTCATGSKAVCSTMYIVAAFVAAWFVLAKWVFPSMGYSTCMTGACPPPQAGATATETPPAKPSAPSVPPETPPPAKSEAAK